MQISLNCPVLARGLTAHDYILILFVNAEEPSENMHKLPVNEISVQLEGHLIWKLRHQIYIDLLLEEVLFSVVPSVL